MILRRVTAPLRPPTAGRRRAPGYPPNPALAWGRVIGGWLLLCSVVLLGIAIVLH